MTKEDITFIEDNIVNFEMVKIGTTRGITQQALQRYEIIYQKYLDANFILTYWCASCVFEMMVRLVNYYENQKTFESPVQEKNHRRKAKKD